MRKRGLAAAMFWPVVVGCSDQEVENSCWGLQKCLPTNPEHGIGGFGGEGGVSGVAGGLGGQGGAGGNDLTCDCDAPSPQPDNCDCELSLPRDLYVPNARYCVFGDPLDECYSWHMDVDRDGSLTFWFVWFDSVMGPAPTKVEVRGRTFFEPASDTATSEPDVAWVVADFEVDAYDADTNILRVYDFGTSPAVGQEWWQYTRMRIYQP